MDQVLGYVGMGLNYGILAAFVVCYVILLGHFLWNKQWLFVFLSLFFTVVFYPVGPFVTLGPLILLVIGWQEANKWGIKKLIRIFTVLFVLSFLLLTRMSYVNYVNAPREDPKAKGKKGAGKKGVPVPVPAKAKVSGQGNPLKPR
jgi:hypothetical protein